jgi:DNA mismatch endonuclease (patch repair protein)
MSHISDKETKPEIMVRKFLFANGFRFRKNVKGLPGKPDIVLAKYKAVILIHGCFWHGHTCKRGTLPTTNVEFWKTKISGNIERDKRDISELEKQGWNVIVIWQCEIKNSALRENRLQSLISEIHNGKPLKIVDYMQIKHETYLVAEPQVQYIIARSQENHPDKEKRKPL